MEHKQKKEIDTETNVNRTTRHRKYGIENISQGKDRSQ